MLPYLTPPLLLLTCYTLSFPFYTPIFLLTSSSLPFFFFCSVFLIYLSLLFITTLSYCISGAYIFVAYFVDRHAIVQRCMYSPLPFSSSLLFSLSRHLSSSPSLPVHSHYQNFEPTLLVTIVGVCSVFVSCIFCLVSQLFFFHIKIGMPLLLSSIHPSLPFLPPFFPSSLPPSF